MMKIALPILLAGIIMIAGIFAFIPIDKATTVHTTIQGSQLNNIQSTFQADLSANATATCSSGSFMVYYTFTNSSISSTTAELGSGTTAMSIDDGVGNDFPDIAVTLALGNQTTVSGVIGAAADETITFAGNSTGATSGTLSFEDTGDLAITVVCQSTATATVVPTPD